MGFSKMGIKILTMATNPFVHKTFGKWYNS